MKTIYALACISALILTSVSCAYGDPEVGAGARDCSWTLKYTFVGRTPQETETAKNVVLSWFQGFVSGMNWDRVVVSGANEYHDINLNFDQLWTSLISECRKNPTQRVRSAILKIMERDFPIMKMPSESTSERANTNQNTGAQAVIAPSAGAAPEPSGQAERAGTTAKKCNVECTDFEKRCQSPANTSRALHQNGMGNMGALGILLGQKERCTEMAKSCLTSCAQTGKPIITTGKHLQMQIRARDAAR
jgi:hypothetical protein